MAGSSEGSNPKYFIEELGRSILSKVPQHAFGQSRCGRAGFAGHAQGDIVAGQHELVDLVEQLRLAGL